LESKRGGRVTFLQLQKSVDCERDQILFYSARSNLMQLTHSLLPHQIEGDIRDI
jgi:hypothetical protein